MVPDDSMGADHKLRLGVPLMISNVKTGLQPNPLLPFSQKPVVTGGTFALFHQRYVTVNHFVQIVNVVVLVTGRAEQFKRQVPANLGSFVEAQNKCINSLPYYRRSTVIQEQKLPL